MVDEEVGKEEELERERTELMEIRHRFALLCNMALLVSSVGDWDSAKAEELFPGLQAAMKSLVDYDEKGAKFEDVHLHIGNRYLVMVQHEQVPFPKKSSPLSALLTVASVNSDGSPHRGESVTLGPKDRVRVAMALLGVAPACDCQVCKERG